MKDTKSRLIQLIHIGKQQLGMEDETYRQMLVRLTNKSSSTKCSIVELHKVVQELQQKGAKISYFTKSRLEPTAYSPSTGSQAVKSVLTHKIRAIWITMGKAGMLKDPSEKGLNRCINAMLNRGKLKKGEILTLYHLHRLNAKEAYRVLEALKAWAKRQGVSV